MATNIADEREWFLLCCRIDRIDYYMLWFTNCVDPLVAKKLEIDSIAD
jgi:hypothetical protein